MNAATVGLNKNINVKRLQRLKYEQININNQLSLYLKKSLRNNDVLYFMGSIGHPQKVSI